MDDLSCRDSGGQICCAMTVGREEGEEGQVPGPPGPPAAGGLVVGGTTEQGAQSEAPATAAVAPPADQEAQNFFFH